VLYDNLNSKVIEDVILAKSNFSFAIGGPILLKHVIILKGSTIHINKSLINLKFLSFCQFRSINISHDRHASFNDFIIINRLNKKD
jgi:hypothetical protein